MVKTHFFISSLKKIVFKGFCVLSSESGSSSYFKKANWQEPNFKCARSPQIQDYNDPGPLQKEAQRLVYRFARVVIRNEFVRVELSHCLSENQTSWPCGRGRKSGVRCLFQQKTELRVPGIEPGTFGFWRPGANSLGHPSAEKWLSGDFLCIKNKACVSPFPQAQKHAPGLG